MRKEFVLTSITLYNMFNYRQEHRIDFTGGKPGNVFLFDVKNGGGKTSLFLSIKWGFYGFDSGVSYLKDGVALHAKDFMNQDEYKEGKFHVVIKFDYDGDHMQLRRSCPDYRSDATELVLTVNGFAERGEKAKEHVMKILPPDYGDFFMFDGETLQKIASQQSDKNKTENVMKLLGLSRLKELRGYLQNIQKAMSSEFSQSKTANSELSNLTEMLNEKQQKEERVSQELKDLNEERSSLVSQISELEEKRRRYSNIQSTIDDITKETGKLRKAEQERDSIKSYIKEHSKDAFLIFMEPDIRSLEDKYEGELSRLRRESMNDRRVRNEFASIQSDIVKEHMERCPVCSSMLTDETFQYLNDLLSQSKDKGEMYKRHRDEENYFKQHLELIRMQLSRIPKNLNSKCNELFETSEKIDGIESRLDELNTIAADSDIEAVKTVSQQLTKLYKKKSDLDKDIFQKKNVLDTTIGRLVNIRNKINNSGHLSKNQKALSERMARLDRLISSLDEVITKVSMDRRDDILRSANNVFRSITNKPDVYSGLDYDENNSFSMHIVRNDGKRSVLPSSGENHVLAISFLISLSLNTERLTPMMMDTPLSRLDDTHKPNIGRTLASLDNQVIFLAQPGELDENTRKALMPSVSKMYSAEPTDDNTACIREVEI